MKKLIVFSVVFALIGSVGLFAADLGVEVFGGIHLMEGNNVPDSQVVGNGGMTRMRVEGSGGSDTFGAWIRLDPAGFSKFQDSDPAPTVFGHGVQAIAWWKPVEQVKISLGGNNDGMFGLEGNTGWGFYQLPNEIGVTNNDNTWGWGRYGGPQGTSGPVQFRHAFYGGFAGQGLMIEITPVEMFALNVVLPYISNGGSGASWYPGSPGTNNNNNTNGSPVAKIFKNMTLQAVANLDFGTIGFTFDMVGTTEKGGTHWSDGKDAMGGDIFVYFGLTAIENLSIDLGFGMSFGDDVQRKDSPIDVGLAAQYDVNDAFGIKTRLLGQFSGPDKASTVILWDVLPYYAISDDLKFFCSLGLGLELGNKDVLGDKNVGLGFHLNPYLQIGPGWMPHFYVGFEVQQAFKYDDEKVMTWKVPIGIVTSF